MRSVESATVRRFGEFELDEAAYELRRRGTRVRLARQPMELLIHLVRRAGDLVTRDEISRQLWRDGVFIDVDAGIHSAILKIRQALGDTARRPRFITTISGKGYRFEANVSVVQPQQPGPTATSRPSAPQARRGNLPAELTSFIGRQAELDELARLLASSRLVTLTGAGGVGKTRLALRAASTLASTFEDGVCLVDLGSLSRPELLSETVAVAVGLREGRQRSARRQLREFLLDREVLLFLDTCEHIVFACAELVHGLLRDSPRLKILSTSREPLSVPGEVVYPVPPLSVPKESAPMPALVDSAAVRLFIERATAVHSRFDPDEAQTNAIVRVCRSLDGIPLAIELAAARVGMLSLEQIEARLEDRFSLLTGGARTTVARQRTLAATLEWSYQLLSEPERMLFTRLAVFPSSWTIEAAEGVCSGEGIDAHDVLDLLSRLVDKSLVTVDRSGTGERRYRFLDTIREYAREQCARSNALVVSSSRHFAYVYNEFRGALPTPSGPEQLPALRRIHIEQDNIRAALDWALSSTSHAEQGVALAGALSWFWTKRSLFKEGRLWLERAAAAPAAQGARGWVLIGLSHADYFQGDFASAQARALEVLALPDSEGEPWLRAFGFFMQALVTLESGDDERAAELALDACRAVDVRFSGPLMLLGNIALRRGRFDQAEALFDESIDSARRFGDVWALGILLPTAAGPKIVSGRLHEAHAMLAEALSYCQQLDDRRGMAWCFEVFAGVQAAGGSAEAAMRMWGAADALLESVGGSLNPSLGWIRTRYMEHVRSITGEVACASAREQGRHMSFEEAIAVISESDGRSADQSWEAR